MQVGRKQQIVVVKSCGALCFRGTPLAIERSRCMIFTSVSANSGLPGESLQSAGASTDRLRIVNSLLIKAWGSGWASKPSLDPDHLIRKAAHHARIGPDEDEVGWRERLSWLCEDLERHAELTALGRTLAHGQLVSALAARFRAHALWQRRPEIDEQPLSAPIILVGQMRSGTTRMQRLLACDPRLRFTRFYESWNPIPADGRPRTFDERKLKGWLALVIARQLNPAFDSIHPTAWHEPDEEIGLHNLQIFGSAFEAQWRVPTFTAAIERSDTVQVYREFRRLIQTLAWLRNETVDRPWILKVPQFSQDLPALLHVFPDARVIYLHRDTDAVVASSASLVYNQMQLQSDRVDPQWIGEEWSRKVRLRSERMASARSTATVPQIDVEYEDVSNDWLHTMRHVYGMIGLPLVESVQGKMDSYMRASCPERRARHAYDPRQFGLAASPSAGMALAL
jgi:hypothetical protein